MTIRKLEEKISKEQVAYCDASDLGRCIDVEEELNTRTAWKSEEPTAQSPYDVVEITNEYGLTISPTDLRW